MKSLVASCIIFLLIISFTVLGSLYILESMKEIRNDIDQSDNKSNDYSETYNIAIEAEKNFSKRKTFLALLLNDKDIDEIEITFEDFKSAAESQNLSDMTKAKNRLISKLEQMRRLCGFNIDSIF